MSRTVKQQLQEIRDLDKSIDSKQRQIDRLRQQAECIKSMDFSKDRVSGGIKQSSQDVICKCIDLEREITLDIDRLIDLKNHWAEKINLLQPVQRNVIEGYYFGHRTFEEIAVSNSFSWRHVMRIHGHALLILEKMS